MAEIVTTRPSASKFRGPHPLEAIANLTHSGLVIIRVSDGVSDRVIGSWRPSRFRKRLVPYLIGTPEWSRELAERLLESGGNCMAIRIQEVE